MRRARIIAGLVAALAVSMHGKVLELYLNNAGQSDAWASYQTKLKDSIIYLTKYEKTEISDQF